MTRTILLTGSGGFVGKNLKRYLENKYELLTPRSFELNCIDEKAVKEYFNLHDIDFIIHCGTVGGAREIQDKDTTIEDNLKMVENLLNSKDKDTRMILFSSGAMYDKSKPIKKAKEIDVEKSNPQDLYGKSKKLITEMVKDREDVTCLTIFACYGYDEKTSRYPSYAIIQNLKHEKIEINQNVIFDYLFVEDLCKIVKYFIKNKPKNNIINITPTDSVDLKTIAEIINGFSDFKSEITVKNSVLGNEYTGDNSRLRLEIPNFKFTKIENGLKFLYNYINKKYI